MKQKISKIIIVILALVFLATGVFYYLACKKARNEISVSEASLKLFLLDANIDETTLDCLNKITIEDNSMVGVQRIEPSPDKPFVEFYYSVYLKSIEETKINNCEATKLILGQAKDNADYTYTVYLPKNLPSPSPYNSQKQIFPAELSNSLGNKIDLLIRYKKGKSYNEDANNYAVDKMLGWKLNKAYYNNAGDLEKILKKNNPQ